MGVDENQPEEFEIYCMDIFLHYDLFNDGYLTKSDMQEFHDHIKESKVSDEKKLADFKNLWIDYSDNKLIDFVSFAKIMFDAGYDDENMN